MVRLAAFTHDTARYIPQTANYLTISFGYLCVANSVAYLRAVMHITRFDRGPMPQPDSAVFDFVRKEYHDKGIQLFREDVKGYDK